LPQYSTLQYQTFPVRFSKHSRANTHPSSWRI